MDAMECPEVRQGVSRDTLSVPRLGAHAHLVHGMIVLLDPG